MAKPASFGSLRGQLRRRTRSSVRRRKLEAAAPGTVILLGPAKRKTKRTAAGDLEASRRRAASSLGIARERRKIGRERTNSYQIQFGTLVDWGMDLDVRKLVRELQIAMAVHFRDQLLAGRKATSNQKLPEVEESTLRQFRKTRGGYGVRTGWMARNWLIFPVLGGPFRAKGIIKPNGAEGRNVMIKWALRQGIDFQGVTGSASRVIQETFQQWVRDMVSIQGTVATPKSANHTKQGTLAEFV